MWPATQSAVRFRVIPRPYTLNTHQVTDLSNSITEVTCYNALRELGPFLQHCS